MKALFTTISVYLLLVLAACSTPQSLNYTPSSALSLNGSILIGEFTYLPAIEGRVAANQIRKTHFSGRFMNRQNIDEFVKESVLKESRSVGIDIRESANILSGEIQELYVDDVKAPIIPFKWYVRIRYIIKDAQSGEVRFDSVKEGRGDVDINIALKANIEELLGDQAFQKIVRKK